MKKTFTLFLFFVSGVCFGQNLVPNPSFEDTIACPIGIGQIDLAVGWNEFKTSTDYLNSCNTNTIGTSYAGVPDNYFGHQNARTGNAYAGLYTYNTFGTNYREVPGIQLTQQLIIGQKYFVKLFISMACNPAIFMKLNIATNKFGARFSTIPYSTTNQIPIDNFAQVYSDSVISDTANWVLISGSFVADSAYNYVSFGNFFTDSATAIVHLDTTSVNAYYYLDDISVSADSLFVEGINNISPNNDITTFPNPFTNLLNISLKNNQQSEITLYDITSRKLLQQTFINAASINTQQLAVGIYFYEVRSKGVVIGKGKVVK